MLGQQRAQLVDDGQQRVAAAVDDRAAADAHDGEPRQHPDHRALDRLDQLAVEQGLAHQRAGDVLRGGHEPLLMIVPTCSPSTARRMSPGRSPLTTWISRTCRAWRMSSSSGRSTTRSGRSQRDQLVDGDLRDQRGRRVGLRVGRVEAVLVLDEDHPTAAVGLGDEVAARVGAVGRDHAVGGDALPHVVRRHAGEDRRAGLGEVERQRAERLAADDGHAVAGHQVAEHLRVLAGDGGADVGQHAGRQAQLGGERVRVPRAGAAAGADQQPVGALHLDELVDHRVHGLAPPVHQALAADLDDGDVGQDRPVRHRVGGRGQLRVAERALHQQRLQRLPGRRHGASSTGSDLRRRP